jgi:hypothetical protein
MSNPLFQTTDVIIHYYIHSGTGYLNIPKATEYVRGKPPLEASKSERTPPVVLVIGREFLLQPQ